MSSIPRWLMSGVVSYRLLSVGSIHLASVLTRVMWPEIYGWRECLSGCQDALDARWARLQFLSIVDLERMVKLSTVKTVHTYSHLSRQVPTSLPPALPKVPYMSSLRQHVPSHTSVLERLFSMVVDF